jgi:beta-N-acetylhexosaminidase
VRGPSPAGRPARVLTTLLVLVLVVAGCASGRGGAPATTAAASATTTAPSSEQTTATTATTGPGAGCALPPLRRQLAQLLVVGFDGTTASPATLALVRQGIGGVILFSRNITGADQVRDLIVDLQAAAPTRLAVGVDQEPGTRVARLRGLVPASPSARALGRRPAEQVYRQAVRLGQALTDLGITVDYAPVLDVTGDGGVIGDRAFGADPAIVARAGIAFERGLKDAGVMPVGKHFPGHGATGADSHKGLPVIDTSLARLEARDMAPFEAAVKAGLPAVMVGHLLVRDLDPERPASLSPAAIRLLRGKLGFDGLVVTDALEMGAIADGWGLPEAGELALEAGVDQLLIGLPDPPVAAVLDRLEAAVEAGRLPRGRVAEAFARVQVAKGERRWASC